jgi:hypothetical protein
MPRAPAAVTRREAATKTTPLLAEFDLLRADG